MGSRDVAMTAASGSRRDTLSTVLIVTGGVLLFVAGFVTATARGVLDSGQFASRLAASLADDRVSRYTADRLTDAVVEQKPDLIPVRPLILATMTGIVRSDPFRGVVRTAARTTHRAVFEQAGRRIVLGCLQSRPGSARMKDLCRPGPPVPPSHYPLPSSSLNFRCGNSTPGCSAT